jgi:ATP-dependent Clp protease protease subunit
VRKSNPTQVFGDEMKRLGVRIKYSCTFASIAALTLLVCQNVPAQIQATPPERSVVINFAVPVDNNSTNGLLRVVSAQMAQGVRKITILISSPGGDTVSAFAAYNILKNLPIDLTTINVGTVDSAALLIYCAASHRQSLDGPGIRFLIHGNSATNGIPLDANALEAQLQQLKNMNQMVVQVLSSVAPKHKSEIEKAVATQQILDPEQAKEWNLVQNITDQLIPPGASFVAVNTGTEPSKETKYEVVSPAISVVSPAISAER